MKLDLEDLTAVWLGLRAHVDELADERQHYLDFFENSTEAYLVTDPDGTIREANGPATDILQRRRGHLRGKPLAAVVALDQRRAFRERLHNLASRAPAAATAFRTVFEAPHLREEVDLTARLIERGGAVTGICWRLQAVQ